MLPSFKFKLPFLKNHLFAPLYTSLAILTVLLLGQEALSFMVEASEQENVDLVNRRQEVKREGEHLLGAILEEKIALRDYAMNRDNSNLKSYRIGEDKFRNSIASLSELVQEDSLQIKQIDEIRTFYARWQVQLTQKVLDGSLSLNDLVKQDSVEPLKVSVRSILDHEKKLLEEHEQRLNLLNQIDIGLSGFNIIVVLAGVGINILLMRRRIEFPLKQLTEIGQSWGAGQLDAQFNYLSPDEIGRLTEVLNAMARDIGSRQERIQQRNQHLEDLIGTLSHDLRTPLLANRSTLDAILGGAFGPVNDTLKELLKEYRLANNDLLKLLETLLDISRYEAGLSQILNREPLNWEKIFGRVISSNHAVTKNKCQLLQKIPPSLPVVYGDIVEIRRVLQNLLDNAVQVSEPGKRVCLEVKAINSQQVEVCVHDEGPGIPDRDKDKLFYRFVQGRGRKGKAGLGLYLCRQIVEAHKGTIRVESKVGKGTRFCFTLPVQEVRSRSDSKQKQEETTCLK